MQKAIVSGLLTVLCLLPAFAAEPVKSSPTSAFKSPFGSFLECTRFTWMDNCDEINKWVAQNPDKPLRINKDGIEWFFPAGTPSVMVEWVLNQTPQALERYMQYMERAKAHHNRAETMYQAALEARGGSLKGFNNIETIRESKPYASLPRVKQGNVVMFVFYSSQCSACKLLEPHIAELRNRYPNIEVSMLQINSDPEYVDYVRTKIGVPAAQLSSAQLDQYRTRVNVTPTIWIEDKRTKQTHVIEGYATLPEIARTLAKVSR